MQKDVALVRSPVFLEHDAGEPHPEHPGRLRAIDEIFAEDSQFASLPVVPLVTADEDLLRMVHTDQLCDSLLALQGESGWIDPDTYYGPKSLAAALKAAGSSADLALRIWKGEYRRGFALVRPPGHHATADRAMGFCLLNNVAIAAQAILREKPSAKIAIVDFDLHHGNGTQHLFYDNPNVLFISSHRFPYYPGTGSLRETGTDRANGTTINFPLPKAYGDELMLPIYEELVAKMLNRFNPEMVLVSAGYDGHRADPIGGLTMSTEAYGRLTEVLVSVAEKNGGKILFCLEGGYDVGALKDSVKLTLERLVDLPRNRFALKPRNVGNLPDGAFEQFRSHHRAYFPEL